MKALLNLLRRFSLTGVMALAALWAGYKLWDYYFEAPWTRDGHVRADVVPIAPDVSGFVTEVLVKDNQQVQRGDVLFRIDRARYEIALKQAEAVLLGKGATLEQANADLTRYSALTPGVVVSKQKMDQVVATQGSAQAAHDQAVADLALAKLNLERSEVRASVNGIVTNMELRPGTYLDPGKGRDGAARFRHVARPGLFRGNQAAAHPSRRCRQRAADGHRSHACAEGSKASRLVSKIAIAVQAPPFSPTSIRPSTGCGWRNVSRSVLRSTALSETNSLRGPRRLSRCSVRHRMVAPIADQAPHSGPHWDFRTCPTER